MESNNSTSVEDILRMRKASEGDKLFEKQETHQRHLKHLINEFLGNMAIKPVQSLIGANYNCCELVPGVEV